MFIKICGMTREEDALLATALGADAVGFVFAPSSRQIAPQVARDIARQLPGDILTVGVFRDESAERVVEIVNGAGLRAAQLHGHESPAECRFVAERVPITIKALPAGSPDLERFDDFGAVVHAEDDFERGFEGRAFDAGSDFHRGGFHDVGVAGSDEDAPRCGAEVGGGSEHAGEMPGGAGGPENEEEQPNPLPCR